MRAPVPAAFIAILVLALSPSPQHAQVPTPPPLAEPTTAAQPDDLLIFRSGDRLTGTLDRIEHGAAIFRGNITGNVTVHFSFIADLKTPRRFAIIKQGTPVTLASAIVGSIELSGDDLVITPTAPALPITIKAADIEYAFDEQTFDREIAHKTRRFEGLSESFSVGGSFIRATERGVAFNTNLSVTRATPGVDFLPRRRRTEINLSDNYELVSRYDYFSQTTSDLHTHIFSAGIEQNEYLHSRFFLLGTYTFDRNYAQGLQAEQLFGAGVGLTLFNGYPQQLDIKTDFHRESQGFTDPANNDTLFGQKISFEYQRFLPGGLSFRQEAQYLPAYNIPHRYSADSTSTLTVPLFRHFLGLTLTATDNYLNVPSPGLRRNTFRLTSSITFTH